MKKKVDYQHYHLEHVDTKEILSLEIDPCPIMLRNAENLITEAMKEQGKTFDENWIIRKAWVGPRKDKKETVK